MVRLGCLALCLVCGSLAGCGGMTPPTPPPEEVQQHLESEKSAREAFYRQSPPGKKVLSPQEKARQNHYRRSG